MKDKGTTKKIHSLIDKVYHSTNLLMAWEKVKGNKGSGGIDNISISDFEMVLHKELNTLNHNLKNDSYKPLPVRE